MSLERNSNEVNQPDWIEAINRLLLQLNRLDEYYTMFAIFPTVEMLQSARTYLG